MFGLARRVLRDAAMAEEVTQEVFIFLWEHPERFDPARGSMRTWLGLLAHSRSVDRVRVEVRRSQREARLEPIESVTRGADRDRRRAVEGVARRAACARPSTNSRRSSATRSVLAYFGGRTYRQVATELAIPEGTAKSRLRLALATLGDLLRPILSDEDTPAWT